MSTDFRPIQLRLITCVAAAVAAISGWPIAGQARVTRMVLDKVTSPNFEGESFGAAGGYEKITGHLMGEVDPTQAENRLIQDIDLAPRNPRGMVEYTADFLLLKPIDMAHGNGILLEYLANRGRTLGLVGSVGASQSNDPTTKADAGDGFLLRRGYSILYIGWQGDLLPGGGRLRLTAPVATAQGQPITGLVRNTYVVDKPTSTLGLGDGLFQGAGTHAPYEPARLDDPTATLCHRGSSAAPWTDVPRAEWAFADGEGAAFPGRPDPTKICLKGGFDPNQVYELIYTAKNPIIMGLGLSAIRDTASFFRHATKDDAGTANPLAGAVRFAEVVGDSQGGNLIRSFLQLGFNRDESGQTVFEGANAHLAGKRTIINVRFATPGAGSTQYEYPMMPGGEEPLTWEAETDPVSGEPMGLLDRCIATQSCPRIIQTFTSTEYRQYAIAFNTVDPSGTRDFTLPPNVRLYFLTGSQHGTLDSMAPPMSAGVCQQARNNAPNLESRRALFIALEDWVVSGKEPPVSQYPTLAASQLAAPDVTSIGWPNIPGVTYTNRVTLPTPLDFGPSFRSPDESGVMDQQPPKVISDGGYHALVPRVDADGNDLGGIRPTAVAAPLGTYTGWNLRREGFGENELCGLNGSFIPLAKTKAEREGSHDPRLSLEERYATHEGYVAAVRRAAQQLQAGRFLLEEDAARLVHEAEVSTVLR
jgi:hypothetical protein